MKTLFSLFLAVALAVFACPAFAQQMASRSTIAIFDGYTGAQSTARNSGIVRAGSNTRSTVVFYGYSTTANALTGGTMTGTAALQGCSSATGPCVNLKDHLGNAVSTTSNAVFNIDSMPAFIRAVWTRTGSAYHFIKVHLITGVPALNSN